MPDKESALKDEMIKIGRRLYQAHLVAARSGNLSCRLDNDYILITATGASLSDLKEEDILKVNLNSEVDTRNERLTSEFPLHSQIHQNFTSKAVIHCHPPLVNGYFAVYSDLKVLTFEAKLHLGNVPVIKQETPSITRPELVIDALKVNNLVAIKNHGVVAVTEEFKDGIYLIEALEEAVKIAGIARLFKKESLDDFDKELKENLTQNDIAHPMFSRQHIQAIVDLVNRDEFIYRKGKELDLTLKLAIKLNEDNSAYKFNFEKGRITKLEFDSDAPFVISAPREVWELIFLGKLDPFVATTQGKMNLKGQLGQLSRWYVPFNRLFELFKKVPFKRTPLQTIL